MLRRRRPCLGGRDRQQSYCSPCASRTASSRDHACESSNAEPRREADSDLVATAAPAIAAIVTALAGMEKKESEWAWGRGVGELAQTAPPEERPRPMPSP